MYEQLKIESYRGDYSAVFMKDAFHKCAGELPNDAHFIVDEKVAELYRKEVLPLLDEKKCLFITANENSKTLDQFTAYVEKLVSHEIRRSHCLVAIGGGITQDIVSFLASTLLRGLPWFFFPTTLLAQADSCIGSKSSINVGGTKNILGTFTPPQKIFIDPKMLKTLAAQDIRSGIGEMLKVHAIAGPGDFDEIAENYKNLISDSECLLRFIRRSLEIKKELIEIDEFDEGPRNIMNYGHSFGHAIESATHYAIPHGIAVSLGMDMANYVAWQLGISNEAQYCRMHPVLAANYAGWHEIQIPHEEFFIAISKDKKNTDRALKLILPDKKGRLGIGLHNNDDKFRKICNVFFKGQGYE